MKFVSLVLISAALNSFPAVTASAAADAAASAGKSGASDLAALRASAERGNTLAQYNLGIAYAEGVQTPRNPVEALVWLTLAAERGTTGAELGALLVSLNSEQISAAGRRLESIRASNSLLRSTAGTSASPAPAAGNTPAPVIAVPAGSSAPSPAIVAIPPPPDPAKQFQDRVNAAIAALQRERTAHAATRAELAALEKRLNELVAGRETQSAGARAADADARSREIIALEKSLAATRDELSSAKTALATANSKIDAAETRARAGAQTDTELTSLRSQVRILERDLQSAVAALKRVATEKPAIESNPKSSAGAAQKVAELQSELNSAKLAAEKEIATRDGELAKLRAATASAESRSAVSSAELDAARRAADEAQRRLARVSEELAESRRHAATATELESRIRQLEAERAALSRGPADTGVSKEEFERTAAARAEVEGKLKVALQSYMLVSRERDELRVQASASRELTSRVRQLETENARLLKGDGDVSTSKAEFERLAAARADAENKLSTALRSFTLLMKERDELRAQVAELSRRISTSNQNE